MAIETEIRGLQELQAEAERITLELHGPPMLEAMRDCALLVHNEAKRLAPVDTGRLRASITPEVRGDGKVVQGIVGSNVQYAAYMEAGTRPHWPPVGALEGWARRHKISAYLVARAIARRGTKAYRYFEGALERHEGDIRRKIGDAVAGIVR